MFSLPQICAQLFSFSLLSRILGLVRDLSLAYVLGTSVQADLLALALRIPHIFRRLLVEGSLSLTITSTFVRLKKDFAIQDLVISLQKHLLFFLGPLILLLFWATPWLAQGLAIDPTLQQNLSHLLFLAWPYLFFVALQAISMAALHAQNHFKLVASMPVLLNLIILLSLGLSICLNMAPAPLVVCAMSLGGFLQWRIQSVYAAKGCEPKSSIKQTGIPRELITSLYKIPLGIFAASTQHLALFIAMIFLSRLGQGQVAAQFYAERLLEFPQGLVGVVLGLVSLPLFSRQAKTKHYSLMSRQLCQALFWAFFFGIPASLGLFAIGPTLLDVLLAHGAFSKTSLLQTWGVLESYLPLILCTIVSRIYLAACVALKLLAKALFATLISLILTFSFCVLGIFPPTAVSLSLLIHTLLLHYFVSCHMKSLGAPLKQPIITLIKITILAVLACSLSYFIVRYLFISSILNLTLAIILAIVSYLCGLKYISPATWRRLRKFAKNN